MKFAFIGMSGSGKSYWAKKFEAYGYSRICCDDVIENKLALELSNGGYSGIEGVAKWMGQPYESRYALHSALYLHYENLVMKEIQQQLDKSDPHEQIVIDTTGSVIYIDKHVLDSLKKSITFIYLKFPKQYEKQMMQLYFDNPKPIIWGSTYCKLDNESENQALYRCYTALLQYRNEKYLKLADKTLDSQDMFCSSNAIDMVLRSIT